MLRHEPGWGPACECCKGSYSWNEASKKKAPKVWLGVLNSREPQLSGC